MMMMSMLNNRPVAPFMPTPMHPMFNPSYDARSSSSSSSSSSASHSQQPVFDPIQHIQSNIQNDDLEEGDVDEEEDV
jgi:hypothetical protein